MAAPESLSAMTTPSNEQKRLTADKSWEPTSSNASHSAILCCCFSDVNKPFSLQWARAFCAGSGVPKAIESPQKPETTSKEETNLGENRYECFAKSWPRRQACRWGKVPQQSRSKITIALSSLLRLKRMCLLVLQTKLFPRQFEELEGGFALWPYSWLLQLTWAGHFGLPRRKAHWYGIIGSRWCDAYNYQECHSVSQQSTKKANSTYSASFFLSDFARVRCSSWKTLK